LNVTRPDRLIGHSPVYFGVGSEYVHLVVQNKNTDATPPVVSNNIDRIDLQPVIRFPFTRLPFLALNTSLMWRNTFWSNSLASVWRDPVIGSVIIPDPSYTPDFLRAKAPMSRRFLEMTANANGPTLVKIWDASDRRFKSSIEPFLQVTHRTAIKNAEQIVKTDYVDSLVGNMTQYAYGVTTHLYMKRTDAGPLAVAREVIGATVQQTYYTDATGILQDQQYRVDNTVAPRSHFSPVSLIVSATPKGGVSSSFRTYFDGRYGRFQQMSADLSWNSNRLTETASWNRLLFFPDQFGQNQLAALSQTLNTHTAVRFNQTRFGLIHSFNYDVRNHVILQQRIGGFYNAQCCGFTAEYQTFDFTHLATVVGIPKDHRIHFSITLAGIGNLSNIFGGLSGTPNR
jgi:hypothetical protein